MNINADHGSEKSIRGTKPPDKMRLLNTKENQKTISALKTNKQTSIWEKKRIKDKWIG